MKQIPPKKKPPAAYQEIQCAGLSKYIQNRNNQSKYSRKGQLLQGIYHQ